MLRWLLPALVSLVLGQTHFAAAVDAAAAAVPAAPGSAAATGAACCAVSDLGLEQHRCWLPRLLLPHAAAVECARQQSQREAAQAARR